MRPMGAIFLFLSAGTLAFASSKLTASNGRSNDYMGWSTATDGVTVIAGAPRVVTELVPGEAYIFERPASGWASEQQAAILKASDGVGTDQFGWSVALSGDTVVVGAPSSINHDAYVFVKPAGGWTNMTETARLTVTTGLDYTLGYTVGISGDTIVMSGFDSTFTHSAVYIFQKPAGGWTNMTQTATLTNRASGDSFGNAVAIEGDTVLAGAPLAAGGAGTGYIFVQPASGWSDTAYPNALLYQPNGNNIDILGYAASFASDTAVLSSPTAGSDGLAAVFVKPAGGWAGPLTPTAKLQSSDAPLGSNFASAVAVNANTVVIGASAESVAGVQFQGAAYVYKKPAAGWQSTSAASVKLVAPDGGGDDQFGWSVAVRHGSVAIGSFGDTVGSNHAQGAVYVY